MPLKRLVCSLFDNATAPDATDKGVGGVAMFRFTAAECQAGIATGLSFPFLVDIIGIQSYEETDMTGNGLITLDKAGSDMATTHTVTAAGSGHSRTAVPDTDTLARDIAPNTLVGITLDSTPSGGSYCVGIEWRHA
jgi:hypothetical protein